MDSREQIVKMAETSLDTNRRLMSIYLKLKPEDQDFFYPRIKMMLEKTESIIKNLTKCQELTQA